MDSTPGTLWVLRMVEERFHRDDEDRPLREGRTPDAHLRPGEIEYRPCPYAGSRQLARRPMNVSALRQTSAHWDELIGVLGFLRAAYADARGSYGPDVMDLWRVSQLGSALPWFFVLPGEPLPAYAAALSKATLGTGILAQCLMRKMLTERWLPPPFTTPALVELSESTGTLVGATEVCSAPEKMIARFLAALVDPTGVDPRPAGAAVGSPPPLLAALVDPTGGDPRPAGAAVGSPLAALVDGFGPRDATRGGVNPPASPGERGRERPLPINRLIAQRDRVLGFGACYAAFKLVVWQYFQARRFLYADIAAARDSAEARALLDAPCEPPDFYVIEPGELAAVPPAFRAAWLGQLANLIVPFAPDGSDRPLLDGARRMAAAMLDDTRDPVARACAVFARLDAIYGDVLADVEAGLRGARHTASIDAAVRDRLVGASPRALFAALG